MEWSEFLEPRITDRDSKINGRQEIFDCSLAFRKLQRYFCLQDKYIKSSSPPPRPRPPGGARPYISYIGGDPHRVGFLRRFGRKTGIHFAHFGLESGMVFEGATDCMNVSLQFQISPYSH